MTEGSPSRGYAPPVRAVVQRVSSASVTSGGVAVGAIGAGLCVLVGVAHDDGPAHAVVSQLEENGVIGLSWAILDYDGAPPKQTGFWNLSHTTAMSHDASSLVAFRLMPLEEPFLKPIEADWDFFILDMDERLAAFRDRSRGTVTSRLWDFDDGSTSTEKDPIHRYGKPGEYTVVLKIEGPEGSARRIRVRDVVFKK